MTIEKLRALCDYWQVVLRIRDWDVTLGWSTYLDLDQCYGLSRTNRPCRHSFIRVAQPSSIPGDHPEHHRDPERTLVHELLHLAIPPDDGNSCSTAMEQGIDAVAHALVNLHRGVKA